MLKTDTSDPHGALIPRPARRNPHVTEMYVSTRSFVLVISPVLLTLALFGATGSAATERTGSLLLAIVAGVWCAIVGTLVLLCVGFVFGLTLEARVELWLRDAFAASGMNDPAGFLAENTLEAASEALVRMPVVALFLSLFGALANAWIRKRSRTAVLVVFCSAVLMFMGGCGRPVVCELASARSASAIRIGWSSFCKHLRRRCSSDLVFSPSSVQRAIDRRCAF